MEIEQELQVLFRPLNLLYQYMEVFGYTSEQEAINNLQNTFPYIIFQFINTDFEDLYDWEGDASSDNENPDIQIENPDV